MQFCGFNYFLHCWPHSCSPSQSKTHLSAAFSASLAISNSVLPKRNSMPRPENLPPISVDGILPVTVHQAPNLTHSEVTLDPGLVHPTFTDNPVDPFKSIILIISTNLVQAAVASCSEHCNNFLRDRPDSSLANLVYFPAQTFVFTPTLNQGHC